MDFQAEYRSKLRTPAEAVRAVKNGDWVDYTSALGFPPLLDAALAARRDELHDVKVRGNLCMGPVQIVECDPEQTHFLYHTWHCSAYERRLCDRGLCYYHADGLPQPRVVLPRISDGQRRHGVRRADGPPRVL